MNNIAIPKQWIQVAIGDCCDVLTGGTPTTSKSEYWGGDIPWMSSGEVNQKRVTQVEKNITKAGMNGSNAKLLPVGAIMMALNGQGKTRGMVAVLEIETTCNQSLAAIVPQKGKGIYNEYLFYNLESRYKEIREITGDNFRSGLNLRIIKNIKFPVPALNGKPDYDEQVRIVMKIKEIEEKASELRNLYTNQLEDIELLNASVLQQAFIGKL